MFDLDKRKKLFLTECVEVTGCTEHAAIAFAFASITKYLKKIDYDKIKVELYLSKYVFRNAST